jgi:acetyltransferase EpsM
METKINLYGASGHCKVIVDLLLANGISIEKIIDDNPKLDFILNHKVVKNSAIDFDENSNWIISIGNNKIRKKVATTIAVNYVAAIHPTAIVSPYSEIGTGTVVMAGVIVNPDSKIGKHCIINTGAIIEHDALIEDYVHICPGVSLAGNVEVGEGTQVGIGATVIQGVKIGKWAIIGAGAVIINDVPDYAVVVGNPGKIVKYNSIDE